MLHSIKYLNLCDCYREMVNSRSSFLPWTVCSQSLPIGLMDFIVFSFCQFSFYAFGTISWCQMHIFVICPYVCVVHCVVVSAILCYALMNFHQTVVSTATWDRDELMFWGSNGIWYLAYLTKYAKTNHGT